MKRPGKTKIPEIVMIEWDDATSADGWHERACLDRHYMARCQTVGFVIARPRKRHPYYHIGMTVDDTGGVAESFKIPKGCIKKIRRLKFNQRSTK